MNLGLYREQNISHLAQDCELARIGDGGNEIARLERMFRVEIVGVLSSFLEDGRVRSILSCRNASGGHSELLADISDEARASLPFVWNTPEPEPSALQRWIGGDYPCEPWLENLFAHHEARNSHRSPSSRRKKADVVETSPDNGNGTRQLQMDRKLRTWIIDAEGRKKKVSCREICEKFDGRIVTQLRAGIDNGADIATVEID